MKPLLEIENVSKDYGSLKALSNVNLNVYPGEIFALLGPNGAGKTTLIGCITGLIRRFDGQIKVAGRDVVQDYRVTRQLVGVVHQELNFDAFFNASAVIKYQGGFFSRRDSVSRAKELLAAFSLSDKAKSNSRWLSGGMKRRLMICKALMHDPPLLFLDEPTAGVDVDLREELWDYVRELRARGTTIVLTTHYLEEAEQLADRIGIIHQGEIKVVEQRDELLNQYGERWISIRFQGNIKASALGEINGCRIEQEDERTLHIAFADNAGAKGVRQSPVETILARSAQTGVGIDRLEGGRSRLEEIFKGIIGHSREESIS